MCIVKYRVNLPRFMSKSHLNVVRPGGTGLGGSEVTVTGIWTLFSFTETKQDTDHNKIEQLKISFNIYITLF